MTTASHQFTTGLRIANFTPRPTGLTPELSLAGTDEDVAIREIKRHADLPFIFMTDEASLPLAQNVLTSLLASQSPCVPYAVMVPEHLAQSLETQMIEKSPKKSGESGDATLDILPIEGTDIDQAVSDYANKRLAFNPDTLKIQNKAGLPDQVDVTIVGAGITGLYAAARLLEAGKSFCLLDKRKRIGGIWSMYANATSRVNTSEAAYRLRAPSLRSNRDHSATREILEDMVTLAQPLERDVFLETEVLNIKKSGDGYETAVIRNGEQKQVHSKGIILAVNDRIGPPRQILWEGQDRFEGPVVSGFGDGAKDVDWKDKEVVVVGMGAFAVENARTALEYGAKKVTVICRRHGTICPKIIDYLNFATPYDETFKHDHKSNIKNMMYWKKLYDLSGATQPECWMGKVKHDGHTISVSDIWFVAHFLGRMETRTGSVASCTAGEIVLDSGERVSADIIVNCVGFEQNAPVAKALSGYDRVTNTNYLDRDFIYLADAYIDGDAFNSFFGSSVLEMVKFYMEVYVAYFGKQDEDTLTKIAGVERIPIEGRAWSHYIAGATALVEHDPTLKAAAQRQVDERTRAFLEKHDLPTYIAENKREWIDLHSMLAGRPMAESECLPYVFERLL